MDRLSEVRRMRTVSDWMLRGDYVLLVRRRRQDEDLPMVTLDERWRRLTERDEIVFHSEITYGVASYGCGTITTDTGHVEPYPAYLDETRALEEECETRRSRASFMRPAVAK